MTFKEHFRTNFNIRLLEGRPGDGLDSLINGAIIRDFKSELNVLKYNQIVIKADPFLFVHNDKLYLFYEEKKRKTKGYIMMTYTTDLRNWSVPVLVLREPFHLSFPFVFEYEGDVYMMPESSEAEEIRIYKFEDDTLSKCSLIHIPVKGHFVDSSIISKGGVLYLFSSDIKYNQRVFMAQELLGVYHEHQGSPLYSGSDYGRNAGSVFEYGGALYRPSQDCSRLYGGNVTLHQVTELNENKLCEKIYKKNILNTEDPFYIYGGHQFNIVEYQGRLIIATDALDLNFNVFQVANKIMKKILKR